MKKHADAKFKCVDPAFSFCARNYKISIFAKEEGNSNNPSLLGRLRNALVNAFNKCTILPKLVVIVLENELINTVRQVDVQDLNKDYTRRLKWLLNEYRKIVDTMHDYLRPNCKQENFPKFIWVSATKHKNYSDNTQRKKFNYVLETLTHSFDNHIALRLVQKWDFNNDNLCQELGITADGIKTLWKSVDKTVEFFETKRKGKTSGDGLVRNTEPERRSEGFKYNNNNRNSEDYHHNDYDFNSYGSYSYEHEDRRYRLPPPPGYGY